MALTKVKSAALFSVKQRWTSLIHETVSKFRAATKCDVLNKDTCWSVSISYKASLLFKSEKALTDDYSVMYLHKNMKVAQNI